MAVEDPTRFDYLFEPIDGDDEVVDEARAPDAGGGVGGAGVAQALAADAESSRKYWPLVAAAATTVLGATIGMVVLWPTPVEAVQTPAAVTSSSSPAPSPTALSSSVAVESASVPPPSAPPELTNEPTAGTVPETAPAPPPVSSAVPAPSSAPVTAPPPTPTLRPPMSVSPEPRPPFPNQQVPDGNGPRGGLLGRGGLL